MKQTLFMALVFGMILIGCGQPTISQTEQAQSEQPNATVGSAVVDTATALPTLLASPQPPEEATAASTEVITEPPDDRVLQQATENPLENDVTQAAPTEAPVATVPEAVPATPEGSDEEPIATPFVGDPIERLQTAVPAPNPDPAQVETIPIYGIGEAAGGQGEEGYARDVTEATSADLAARLGVGVDAIVVVRGAYTEVQSMAPCGTTVKDSGQPMGDGMEFGYEIVYEVSGATYRYIGVGGLAYYCGAE